MHDIEQKQKTKEFSTSSYFYFLRHICLVSKKGGCTLTWGISFIDKIWRNYCDLNASYQLHF